MKCITEGWIALIVAVCSKYVLNMFQVSLSLHRSVLGACAAAASWSQAAEGTKSSKCSGES